MKLLQVVSYLYPAWSYGGPGKLVYELSQYLVKNGYEVGIYTTDAFDQFRRRGKEENEIILRSKINLKVFKNISNKLAFKDKLFFPPMALFFIPSDLARYDIVHIHEIFTPLAIFSAFFAQKFGIPYVVSAHGTLDVFHLSHRKGIKDIFMKTFGNRIIDGASAMIAATNAEKEEYKRFGIPDAKIFLVRNGIDWRAFSKLPNPGGFRRKYKIGVNAKVILYLGRINKLKGLDTLVLAFEKLVRLIKDCVLVIAGSDDGYLETLKKLVRLYSLEDKVFFPGVSFGLEKLSLLKDANIFVYPSPSEGFSIAVLEAAASSLPLVLTRGCKFPDVEKDKAGIIVESGAQELYEAVLKILKNKDLSKTFGQNASDLIRNNYSIEAMGDSLVNIYRRLLNQ